MTLRNLAYWRSHGEPYRLARPLDALQARLQDYGYIVYDYPNEAHLEASTPEDHTPFSATGWPGESPFGIGFAIDIMPPAAVLGLPTIAELAEQILLDMSIGLPGLIWLKYMNSTEADGDCWHDAWRPGHTRTRSRDKGHIHLSGRTDCASSPVGDHYDPVARFRARKDTPMLTLFYVKGAPDPRKLYATDGMTYRWIRTPAHLAVLQARGLAPATNTALDTVDASAFGRDADAEAPVALRPGQVVALSEEQLAELAREVAALVDRADFSPELLVDIFNRVNVSTTLGLKA